MGTYNPDKDELRAPVVDFGGRFEDIDWPDIDRAPSHGYITLERLLAGQKK
jgi:hypothetical protein